MRSKRGSRRIEVGGVTYRWRARGDDGFIAIGIWPADAAGPHLQGNLRYHEAWLTAGDQIVVTARLVRRVIEHAIAVENYDPLVPGKEINLTSLDDVIQW